MSVEQLILTPAASLKLINTIQSRLIEMSGMDPYQWIEKNSPIFRQLIEERPEILDEFSTEPDKVLADLQKKLVG